MIAVEWANTITKGDFDPDGNYKSAINVVKEVGGTEVGYYSAKLTRTRRELFVLSVDVSAKRLVGLKVLVVET